MSVVSGLALGIDAAAHEGCLKAGGITVAILAHGLDRITPHSNRGLADQILESEGCLVAEHAPGVPPVRQEYVRRNRIQSGMAACSIMVESAEEGGAIHQGNFAARQGRPLYVVTPPAGTSGSEDFKYAGAERLMKEAKARPIGSRADLEAALDRLDRVDTVDSLNAPPQRLL
jgi:DNA processing protein